jgi:hypothetical protein
MCSLHTRENQLQRGLGSQHAPRAHELANSLRLSTTLLSQDLSGAWVTIGGESQPGQVPLHRIRQGPMPPNQILPEILNGSLLAHTKGHEGNFLTKTQI